MIARRLLILLGMAVVGVGIAIVGVPASASAGILLGNCANITTLFIGTCPGDTEAPLLHYQSTLTGETATVTGFVKTTPGPTATNLFVDQGLIFGQNGVGISFPSGGLQNEINATNFVSIKPDNPNSEFATLVIDSLQEGEMARVCPEPTAISVPDVACAGGATLTGTADPASVQQTVTIPLTPGGVASVTGINNLSTGGAFGDVKIEAFDATVPEPGTLALLFTGVAGLFLVRKRNLI